MQWSTCSGAHAVECSDVVEWYRGVVQWSYAVQGSEVMQWSDVVQWFSGVVQRSDAVVLCSARE